MLKGVFLRGYPSADELEFVGWENSKWTTTWPILSSGV